MDSKVDININEPPPNYDSLEHGHSNSISSDSSGSSSSQDITDHESDSNSYCFAKNISSKTTYPIPTYGVLPEGSSKAQSSSISILSSSISMTDMSTLSKDKSSNRLSNRSSNISSDNSLSDFKDEVSDKNFTASKKNLKKIFGNSPPKLETDLVLKEKKTENKLRKLLGDDVPLPSKFETLKLTVDVPKSRVIVTKINEKKKKDKKEIIASLIRKVIRKKESGDDLIRKDTSGTKVESISLPDFDAQIIKDPSNFSVYCLDIKKGIKLGEGNFGTVYKGKITGGVNEGKRIVIKLFHQDENGNGKISEEAKKEAEIMCRLSHENIVKFYGCYLSPNNKESGVVMAYETLGDLRSLLQDNSTKINVDLQIQWIKNIVAGMKYLHANDIIHRDLATRNVLIGGKNLFAKITDFGLSRNVKPTYGTYTLQSSNGQIPIGWTSPEALFEHCWHPSSDVWSFGIVIYEIFSFGKRPYEGKDITGIIIHIQKFVNELKFEIYEEFEKEVSKHEPSLELMKQCLSRNPLLRPSFDKILEIVSNEKYRKQNFDGDNNNVTKQSLPLAMFEFDDLNKI